MLFFFLCPRRQLKGEICNAHPLALSVRRVSSYGEWGRGKGNGKKKKKYVSLLRTEAAWIPRSVISRVLRYALRVRYYYIRVVDNMAIEYKRVISIGDLTTTGGRAYGTHAPLMPMMWVVFFS